MRTDPRYRTKVFWLMVVAVVVPFGWAMPLFRGALAPAIARRPARF